MHACTYGNQNTPTFARVKNTNTTPITKSHLFDVGIVAEGTGALVLLELCRALRLLAVPLSQQRSLGLEHLCAAF